MEERYAKLYGILTVSLGCLWIVDGVLQLQPLMFTPAFVNDVLAPVLQSQPGFIAGIIGFGITVFSAHILLANLLSAFLQLGIGASLIAFRNEKVRRATLWVSIVWALIVWIFGEGLGILFTGSATFYTGAPGSALLYLVLALFLIRAQNRPEIIGRLPFAAGTVFVLGAILNMVPMFWRPTMLSMLSMIPRVSGWLGVFGGQGTMVGNILAFEALLCIGIILMALPNRTTGWITLIFLFFVWWIGQYFGGLLTFPFGTATDPNSAPVLALFILPLVMALPNIP